MADAPDPHMQALEKAAAGELPNIYFNGFSTALSNADINAVLSLNGKATAVVNMSFTVAKTLSVALAHAVARIEETAGTNILTTQDIDAGLQSSGQKSDKPRASDVGKAAGGPKFDERAK